MRISIHILCTCLLPLAWIMPSARASTTTFGPNASSELSAAFQQARSDYFKALQGHADASRYAEEEFSALHAEYPNSARVRVYWGSLELWKAAHSWNVLNLHSLTLKGIADMDSAVSQEPNDVEIRYIRAATEYHLPAFLHKKDEAEQDFAWIAPRAQTAVEQGRLPAPLAASALDTYGCILLAQRNRAQARQAFEDAIRLAPESPAGRDAENRLKPLS